MGVIWLGFGCAIAAGDVICVDVNAPPGGDGLSWGTPYKYLQDALAEANSHPDVNEIRVGRGIYKPDQNSADPNGNGDKTATFQLINGVAIKGGYAGFGAPNPNARNINVFRTILSGDLYGNDVDVNDPADLLDEPTRAENSYHVVSGSGTDANTILDGFTITGGNANGFSPDDDGGGLYNNNGSLRVINCTFRDNSANDGGGMHNSGAAPVLTNCTFSGNSARGGFAFGGGMMNSQGSPTLTNCTFIGNSADSGGGGMSNWEEGCNPTLIGCTFSGNWADIYGGGGMYNQNNSTPTLTNCTFSGNSATDGGGMCNYKYSNPTLTGCTFSGNSAQYGGGGMLNLNSNSTLTNCTFIGNSAVYYAGGMDNYYDSNSTLTNCIFTGNWGGTGGGMDNYSNSTLTNCTFSGNSAINGGAMYNWDSNSNITNCILWGNTAERDGDQIAMYDADYPSTAAISYSNVQGGLAGIHIDPDCSVIWGLGNIDIDPCFVDPGRWVDGNEPNIVVEPNDPNAVWVDGDYHLKSQGWRLQTRPRQLVWDAVTSSCIDAGNPGSPLGAELLTVPPDPNHARGENLRINMGVYGGTRQASMPPYDWALLADITNDGIVDGRDYAHQAKDWLTIGAEQPGDLNKNGIVNIRDLALFVDDWLETTSWY
jgi:hypothetical protein